MSTPSTFECFGLVIQGYPAEEILRRIDQNASEGRQTMIVTANPEILLEGKKDPEYWNTLRQADLRLVDGIALKFAGWIAGTNPVRLSGVDLSESLLQAATQRGWKVAMVGGDPGNADKAAWEIRKAYPSLSIFAERGGIVNADGTDDEAGEEMLFRLTQFAPDLLLVGFGHPRQERWIARHLHDLPSVKVAVGVGGTIDYWSGIKRRAPLWMRNFGLEWLYRLIKEPSRWKRIGRAVFVFPYIFLIDRMKKGS